MKYFKIVYMGTPDFAVPALKRLIEDGHEITGVVTQPDRKRGRGGKITYSPIKLMAVKYGIKILQPEKIRRRETVEELKKLNADLFVTCAYGQILSSTVLNIPKFGCINIHASLLPKYRGAAPIHRAVLNGDTVTGVTTMMTDRGMDTGDILLKSETEIDINTTTGELHDTLMNKGADLISKTLVKLGEGELKRYPQDNEKATYAPLLKKEESVVDWSDDSKKIHNKVRALNPWPGCFTSYKDKRMRIIKSDFSNNTHIEEPGTIVLINKDEIMVACGSGYLRILELQFENSRAMRVSKCWHNIENNIILGQGDE